MLKLIVLRLHKQKTSQKIVFFFLKQSFLTIIYEYVLLVIGKVRPINKILPLLKYYL